MRARPRSSQVSRLGRCTRRSRLGRREPGRLGWAGDGITVSESARIRVRARARRARRTTATMQKE